ncbi:MAG: hypothetical protein WAO28_02710 [Candidatus Microsaccharimonas sp.]
MKLQSKKQPKKLSKLPFLLTLAGLVLLGVLSLTYVYVFNGSIFGWNNRNTPTNEMPLTNLETPTDEQIQAGDDIKKGNLDNPDGSSGAPTTPTPQPGSAKQSVEVIITATNQNNGILQVRTQISRVVNTGQCTVTLTKSGNTVTKTADTQALASTSTCKGFDIPVSELSAGSWNMTLTYESDTLLGTNSKVITIQ